MARPPKPVVTSVPQLTRLCTDLRQLKLAGGNLTFRQLGEKANYSASRLSEAASGRMLPTWEVTSAFVLACGGAPEDWRERWDAAAAAVKVAQAETLTPSRAVESRQRVVAVEGQVIVPKMRQTVTVTRLDPLETHRVDSPALFNADLRERISNANRSLRAVAQKSGYATSTVSSALSGQTLPRWDLVSSLLGALRMPSDEQAEWRTRWTRLAADEVENRKTVIAHDSSYLGRRPRTFLDLLDKAMSSQEYTRRLALLVIVVVSALIAFVGVLGLMIGAGWFRGSPLGSSILAGFAAVLMSAAQVIRRRR